MPRSQAGLGGDVVPGWRAVRELLVAKRRRVKKLLIDRDREKPDEEVLELAREAGVRREFVEDARIAREARIETHQGVVALAGPVPAVSLDGLRRDTAGVPRRGRRGDRSAEPRRHPPDGRGRRRDRRDRSRVIASASLAPAAVKAAAGAVEHLPIALVGGIPGALEQTGRARSVERRTRRRTARHRCASSRSRTRRSCSCSAPRDAVCRGSPVSAATCSRRIPMHGQLDSLNVAAAAAVACFEVARAAPLVALARRRVSSAGRAPLL